jgi:nucleotide-binding universal stress UspA family protein
VGDLVPEDLLPIVVGVDGSAHARDALRWAADDAVRRGRPLRIVHAVEPWTWEVPLYPAAMAAESIDETGKKILQEALDQVSDRHADLPVTAGLAHDPPIAALRELARDAYEVVVGHRGHGGFAGLLLGSVGLHTAGYADGTVVVVRGGERPRQGEVVAGIDLSANSDAALEHAFDAAATRAARLRAVHAWCPPEGLYAVLEVADLAEAAVETVREVLRPWRIRYPRVEVAEQTIRSHPIEALVRASGGADLVVVAARGHSGVRLGSVSHGLIHHAACPVAVVRPRPTEESG